MLITVKYFAILRELTGKSEERIELAEGCDVTCLFERLEREHPSLKGLLPRLSIAVDRQYASRTTLLKEGAEVALLPPVAGGDEEEEEEGEQDPIAQSDDGLLQLRRAVLDVQEITASVVGDFAGGIVNFIGIVRDNSHGHKVRWLEYEAYPPMVISELEKIRGEIAERWPEVKVTIHHRIGKLSIGERVIVIAVAAPHRQEGFAACSYAIDRIKETVPIWKKEIFEDGSSWSGWGA